MQMINIINFRAVVILFSILLLSGCFYPSDENSTVIHSVRRDKELIQVASIGEYGFGPYDVYVVIRDLGGNVKLKEQISINNIDMSYDTKKYIYDVIVIDGDVVIKVCSFEYLDGNAIAKLMEFKIIFIHLTNNEKCLA